MQYCTEHLFGENDVYFKFQGQLNGVSIREL